MPSLNFRELRIAFLTPVASKHFQTASAFPLFYQRVFVSGASKIVNLFYT